METDYVGLANVGNWMWSTSGITWAIELFDASGNLISSRVTATRLSRFLPTTPQFSAQITVSPAGSIPASARLYRNGVHWLTQEFIPDTLTAAQNDLYLINLECTLI